MRNHFEEYYRSLQARGGLRNAIIIALLLHAESNEAAYKLESARSIVHEGAIPLDTLPGARVEHFDLIKK